MKKLVIVVSILLISQRFSLFTSSNNQNGNTLDFIVVNNVNEKFNLMNDTQIETPITNTIIQKNTVTHFTINQNNYYQLVAKQTSSENIYAQPSYPVSITQFDTYPVFLAITSNTDFDIPVIQQINNNNDPVIIINNTTDQDFTLTIPIPLAKSKIQKPSWLFNENVPVHFSQSDDYTITTTYKIPNQQITVIQRPDHFLLKNPQKITATLTFSNTANNPIFDKSKDVKLQQNKTQANLTIDAVERNNAALFTIKQNNNSTYSVQKHIIITENQS